MVDLKTQYEALKPQIDQAIQSVIDNTAFIKGPEVQAFQKELEDYLDVPHVIPCANGTDALQIAMMALDLKPGDEVITATFTYVATAEVIALLGLTPVLVDVDPNTFLIDPQAVKEAISDKTKAIVPVHLFGQCAPMEELKQIAEDHGLFIIEDTAQAIGANYTFTNGQSLKAGTIGDVGTTSFFPSKNLGCYGDGGALFTRNASLAAKIRMIANHGQSKRYYHDEIGVNSRLDTIQAAILRCKLPHLNTYNANRRKAAEYYDQAFKNNPALSIPVRADHTDHVFHQYTLKLNLQYDRDELIAFLAAKEIPAMIYYPVALHMQKAYQDERYSDGSFPVTEKLVKQVFSLPMHPELDREQQDYIINGVLEFLNHHQ